MQQVSDLEYLNSRTKKIPGGCWEWRSVGVNGYGSAFRNGKHIYAHRFSYLIFVGEVPEKFFVCHSCDNRRCINPGHLFLGKAAENARDMVLKSRSAKGEDHSQAVLTNEKVLKIKSLLSQKFSQSVVARKFGVSRSCIAHIAQGNRWGWLRAE